MGRYLLASHLAATTPSARPRTDRSWLIATLVFLAIGGLAMGLRGCR